VAAQLTPCSVAGLTGDVRCGTVDVFENRTTRSGRRLALSVIVARATEADRAPDPFFLFAGGPGQAASGMVDFANTAFSVVRRTRDLVLVDVRGTGQSNPLNCRLYRKPTDFLGEFYPEASVRHCRDSLGALADLRQYTTPNIADDIDDVRAALGYDRINIYGTSYGSRLAFVYMRQHPGHVRSVVMKAIVPTNAHMPMGYAQDADRALELLARDCAADRDCAAEYPNFASEFRTVVARAKQGTLRGAWPAQRAMSGIQPGDSITIDADALTSTVMGFMQSVGSRASLPRAVHRAFLGDGSELLQAILFYRTSLDGGQIAIGMHLSVMCSEDTRWLDPRKAAEDNARSFLGDARVRAQLSACRNWPQGDPGRGYDQPVRGDAPVLLVSGELDPNTPARWGEEALKTLPNGRHVILPLVAHNFSSAATCGAQFVADFIERASARDLDLSCATQIRLPPFAR
jgi:pimeloyl-ACP methyl ester carboxylesterase